MKGVAAQWLYKQDYSSDNNRSKTIPFVAIHTYIYRQYKGVAPADCGKLKTKKLLTGDGKHTGLKDYMQVWSAK